MADMDSNEVQLAQIVAMSRDRIIGVDNALPWHLPEDLRHFKSVTMGKPIIMGRKTWESIGRPLPGRANIVVSRREDLEIDGVEVFADLAAAIAVAKQHARAAGLAEAMIIGGAEIYNASVSLCRRVYLTEVDVSVEGDARYPVLPENEWVEVTRECYPAVAGERPGFCFVILQKNDAK